MKGRKEVITSDTVLVEKENGKTVIVTMEEQAKGEMTYADLYAITSEVEEDDCKITIYEMVDLNDSADNVEVYTSEYTKKASNPLARAWYDLYYKVTTWIYPGEEIEYEDNFIISVAKGETVTLDKKYKYTLAAEIGAETDLPNASVVKANLNGSITHEISKSEKFTGPSENSSYNSREYRCKYYMNEGWFMSIWEGNFSDEIDIYDGSYLEPSRYARYSIDSKIR